MKTEKHRGRGFFSHTLISSGHFRNCMLLWRSTFCTVFFFFSCLLFFFKRYFCLRKLRINCCHFPDGKHPGALSTACSWFNRFASHSFMQSLPSRNQLKNMYLQQEYILHFNHCWNHFMPFLIHLYLEIIVGVKVKPAKTLL